MVRNRFAEYMATAPLWQWFLYFAVSLAVVMGLSQPLWMPPEAHPGWLGPAVGGMLGGALMTTFVGLRRRREQSATGGRADDLTLRRALDGQVPVETEQAQALAVLLARRRRQLRHARVATPLCATLVGMVCVVVGLVLSNWWLLVLAVVEMAVAIHSYFTVRDRLARLDALSRRLPSGPV